MLTFQKFAVRWQKKGITLHLWRNCSALVGRQCPHTLIPQGRFPIPPSQSWHLFFVMMTTRPRTFFLHQTYVERKLTAHLHPGANRMRCQHLFAVQQTRFPWLGPLSACAACLVTGSRKGRQRTSNREVATSDFYAFPAIGRRAGPASFAPVFGGRSKSDGKDGTAGQKEQKPVPSI